MITKNRGAKDGETIDRDRIKDGKIVIHKIKMVSLIEMGIIGMAIT
jgi:hypothetical protein